jgi:hypothetical protein
MGFAVLLGLSCTSCTQTLVQGPAAAAKTRDLAHRRLTGRESLLLAPGVRIHSDRMFTSEPGAIQFRGHIFLDASTQEAAVPDHSTGWPAYAYADQASWNVEPNKLILQGHVAVETAAGVLVEGTQNKTTVAISSGHLQVAGPTRTSISSPLKKL